MRTSSAQQLEFDALMSDPPAGEQISNPSMTAAGTSALDSSVAPATGFRAPNFQTRGQVYALTSRLAGRVNAAGVSLEEHQALLQERQSLLDKKFDGRITRPEANRLEYVRWSLDRIEDAKHGQSLDILEDTVSTYERFVRDVRSLSEQLSQYKRPRR